MCFLCPRHGVCTFSELFNGSDMDCVFPYEWHPEWSDLMIFFPKVNDLTAHGQLLQLAQNTVRPLGRDKVNNYKLD